VKAPELDLITLTVTPEEARMLQTACINNSLRIQERNITVQSEVANSVAGGYLKLSLKINAQAYL
jgi:hypothetical protein